MTISQGKLLQIALYSNAFYVFLMFLFRPNGINIQKLFITSFLIISVSSVFILALKNRNAFNELTKSIKVVIILLFTWSALVVIRSFSLSIQDWVTNFGNVYMAFAWFVPVMLFIGSKIELWKDMIKGIFFMFFLMLIAVFTLPFQGRIWTEWTWLLRPVNFILIMGIHKKSMNKLISIIVVVLIYCLIATLVKQRIEFLFLALVLLFLTIDKLKRLKRTIVRYIFVGFLFVLWAIFTFGYEYVTYVVSYVVDFQDSRTFLFKELLTELSPTERFVGRGSLGTYFSQFFENTRRYFEAMGFPYKPGDVPDRITIEVSYLQMILKGGYILLFLTAYPMFYAAYAGIFKSKNKFCRRLGFFILILSILSIVSFRPAFTPMFIILWMSIGTVLNKKNRDLTNEEIRNILNY